MFENLYAKPCQQSVADMKTIFERLSRHRKYSDTFDTLLDFSLWMMKPNKTEEELAEEKKYDVMYPDKEDAKLLGQLFLDMVAASHNDGKGFFDALGDLFMEYVSRGNNGQFFTPQSLCDMMALMQHGDNATTGGIVVDPGCGSGRTLMALAKLDRYLKFYGADNDITCCKMAVINMVLNTMEGEIAWMDSESMEHYKSWHIEKILLGGYYWPLYHTTGKGETHFGHRLRGSTSGSADSTEQEPLVIVKFSSKDTNQLSLFENSDHERRADYGDEGK